MAELVLFDQPNCITQSLAPGDTGWHLIPVPAAVPPNRRLNVTAAFCAVGAAGAAATTLVDFNLPATPTVGFPILSGTTLVIAAKNNYWYKLGAATDTLYILWSF